MESRRRRDLGSRDWADLVTAPLTVTEVAERLRVSERYVLDELRRKNMRGAKLAGRAGWRITEADLATYIEAHMNVSRVRGRGPR